jgi:two-component system, OmpR family, phosphate regulon sensor histidine kinase PhoR
MKSRFARHIVPPVLMFLSLALLLVFQLFWLRTEYLSEYAILKKEINNSLEVTIRELQDSLIEKSVQINPNIKQVWERKNGEELKFMGTDEPFRVSSGNQIRIRNSIKRRTPDTLNASEMKIIVASTPDHDSLGTIAGAVLKNVFRNPDKHNLFIRIALDSLSTDIIIQKYKAKLHKAGIFIPFVVKSIESSPFQTKTPELQLTTMAFIQFPSQKSIKGYFENHQYHLFGKIATQIVFSFILFSVTIAAFYGLYRSLRQQRRLTELKSEFINNITHELKTPITTLGVAIEALQSFNVLENKQLTGEYLDISGKELNRLAILVDKILKTAIFEKKGLDINKEILDCKMLVEQVIDSMQLLFEKNQAQISIITEGNDFRISADSAHLTNVLYNLLDNALKYSINHPVIEVSLQDIEGNLCISIKDNGHGISPEYQKKIFEKFFRVPSGNIHNTKGYGLGLSYVASVIKSHGGKIELNSVLGKGSKFKIILPKA